MDQQPRIEDLKRRAAEASGGRMSYGGIDRLEPDRQEEFWTRVLAFETAPQRPLLERLAESGLAMPPAGRLDEAALHGALWAIIGRLAEWRRYLLHTDHLDERELYTLLREEVLCRPDKELAPELGYSTIFDLSFFDGGLRPGTVFLRYYADRQTRRALARERPDDELPPHCDPPHERDRRLPAPRRGPVIVRPPFIDDDEPALVIH